MRFWKILSVLIVTLVLANSAAAQQLTVRWGLDTPTDYYEERLATPSQNAADWSKSNEDEKMFRYFTIVEPAYTNAIFPLFGRAAESYDQHLQRGGAPTRRAFSSYVRVRDPYLVGRFRSLAPRLFFDFMGSVDTQYVLTDIIVQVLDFSEYKGGGFADDEYSYDIVLIPEPGTYRYGIDRRLRFNGSGRAELTFFSDNFYPTMGLSPMGAYMIDLTFIFLANGSNSIKVVTGPFKIDV